MDHVFELGVAAAAVDGVGDESFVVLSVGFAVEQELADFMSVGGGGGLFFLFAGLEKVEDFFVLEALGEERVCFVFGFWRTVLR